ncbi:MAG: hypothetical protein RR356_04465 [Bacteroidales bacterium]
MKFRVFLEKVYFTTHLVSYYVTVLEIKWQLKDKCGGIAGYRGLCRNIGPYRNREINNS